jgi:hypothetical protein
VFSICSKNLNLNLKLYVEKKKRQISLWGTLDQIKYFGGANRAKILFKGVSGQSELFEVVKMAFLF